MNSHPVEKKRKCNQMAMSRQVLNLPVCICIRYYLFGVSLSRYFQRCKGRLDCRSAWRIAPDLCHCLKYLLVSWTFCCNENNGNIPNLAYIILVLGVNYISFHIVLIIKSSTICPFLAADRDLDSKFYNVLVFIDLQIRFVFLSFL